MTAQEVSAFLGATDVPRDRYGRPLIKQVDGTKPTPYTRCTTFVSALEDTYNLQLWSQRMVALGLAHRPDLLLSVSAHADDKKQLNNICSQAREASAASSKATIGTALHRICERLDNGEDFAIPEVAKADVEAYQAATYDTRWTHVERITVHDGLKVAGTPDRIGRTHPDEQALVWDIKTGTLDWGMGKIAMQLALYAHSLAYNIDTGERTPLDVDLTRAIIIHLPAGEGRCDLVEVDIEAGWEAVQHAAWVRGWRARKDLSKPYTPQPLTNSADSLTRLIENAPTLEALVELWSSNIGRWTPGYTQIAALRRAALTAA